MSSFIPYSWSKQTSSHPSASTSKSPSIEFKLHSQIFQQPSQLHSLEESSSKTKTKISQLACLALLVLQTSLLVLLLKWSSLHGKSQPNAAVLVVLCELVKVVASVVAQAWSTKQSVLGCAVAMASVAIAGSRRKQLLALVIPSAMYAVQNNLVYAAVNRLSPLVFQASNQLKILTTAVFSVLLLDRRLSKWKWMALVLLCIGVILVQTDLSQVVQKPTKHIHGSDGKAIDSSTETKNSSPMNSHLETKNSSPVDSKDSHENTSNHNHKQRDRFIGLIAVLSASILSGLAGVIYECQVQAEPTIPSKATRNPIMRFILTGRTQDDLTNIPDSADLDAEAQDLLESNCSRTPSIIGQDENQETLHDITSLKSHQSKNNVQSIWQSSFEMSLVSVPLSIALLLLLHSKDTASLSIPAIWNNLKDSGMVTCWIILVQAVGGLLVAKTVSVAGSIIKVFGSSLSLCLSAVLSWLVFGVGLEWNVCLGSLLVVASVFLYSK